MKSKIGSLKINWCQAWLAKDVARCREIEGRVAREFKASTLARFLRETVKWSEVWAGKGAAK
jgi:hypothetical protein